MEFMGDIDDDLFEKHRERDTRTRPSSYKAKNCNLQWFEGVTSDNPSETMQIRKYQGDWAYRRRDFRTALHSYEAVIDLLPPSNTTVMRDVLESVTRCQLELQQPEQALLTSQKLTPLTQSYDQNTVCVSLLASVYNELGRSRDELLVLQKFLWLHPMHCDAWVRMTQLYLDRLRQQSQTTSQRSSHDDPLSKPGDQQCLNPPSHVSHTNCAEDSMPAPPVDSSSGIELRSVVCTCLLRSRSLASGIRKHPQFVTERYQQIYKDLSQEFTAIGINEELVKRCLPHVTRDLNVDATPGPMAECRSEVELVKDIENPEFQTMFERHWFSWH